MLGPVAVDTPPAEPSTEAGLKVAGQVRDIRRARHLSQRQLAGRMEVPRTYISKIENGKAIPTLGSLERLAEALGVDVCQLVRDARSRRDEEVASILSDPLLAEIAALLPALDSAAPVAGLRSSTRYGDGPPAFRVRSEGCNPNPASASDLLTLVAAASHSSLRHAHQNARANRPIAQQLRPSGACATVDGATLWLSARALRVPRPERFEAKLSKSSGPGVYPRGLDDGAPTSDAPGRRLERPKAMLRRIPCILLARCVSMS